MDLLASRMQVLLLVPVFLLPVFLPRQSAHAGVQAPPQRVLEVWPANHHREAAFENTSTNTNTSNSNRSDDLVHAAFVSDVPSPLPAAEPLHQHVQQPVKQPVQQPTADSPTSRVAGLQFLCIWHMLSM